MSLITIGCFQHSAGLVKNKHHKILKPDMNLPPTTNKHYFSEKIGTDLLKTKPRLDSLMTQTVATVTLSVKISQNPNMGTHSLNTVSNYTTWADWMNTNHQLVRGNYTAKANSMGTGQIGVGQKRLLWDWKHTMLSAVKWKTGENKSPKFWQNICGQTDSESQRQN